MSPFALTFQTLLALLAFAGNSVLCRQALNEGLVDANSFTIIRLISGALMLMVLIYLVNRNENIIEKPSKTRLLSAAYLFVYAACFSIAYVMLGTAAGALILFVSVQFTMLLMQYMQGRRSRPLELMGVFLALASFATWILPSAQRPNVMGVLLMCAAGIAWALYTLAGNRAGIKTQNNNTAQKDTAQNFFYSVFFCVLLIPLYSVYQPLHITWQGLMLAVTSGAITSGLGYWLWYRVLPAFTPLSAGVMQLSVPILAAVGGIIWNNETLTLTFVLASIGILGGILLVLYSGHQQRKQAS